MTDWTDMQGEWIDGSPRKRLILAEATVVGFTSSFSPFALGRIVFVREMIVASGPLLLACSVSSPLLPQFEKGERAVVGAFRIL